MMEERRQGARSLVVCDRLAIDGKDASYLQTMTHLSKDHDGLLRRAKAGAPAHEEKLRCRAYQLSPHFCQHKPVLRIL